MIHDRIRRARLLRGLSLQEMADAVGDISKQALSKFETGKDTPNSSRLLQLAKVLDLKPEYFFRPDTVELGAVEFRKHTKLGKKQQYTVLEQAREHIERYLELEGFFEAVQPARHFALKHTIAVASADEAESAAGQLREQWNLGTDAIHSVTELLEEEGIKVVGLEAPDAFDGLSATLASTGDPVIIINSSKAGERQRFTLAHELGHLLMKLPADMEDKDQEKLCHRFAGAFLFHADQVREDFGNSRKRVEVRELMLAKKYYGISMQAILHRLLDVGVIAESTYRGLMMYFGKQGWRKDEPCPCNQEQSIRFESMVYHGLAEGLFSASKAAELLQEPLAEIEPG